MAKGKLPVEKTETPNPVISSKMADSDRKWKAEDALRTIERAEEHRKDKDLMKDVKRMAREKVKTLSKMC